MLMATAAPSLLVGLVAGVYVDRYDRRKIMIISDLFNAVLVCSSRSWNRTRLPGYT